MQVLDALRLTFFLQVDDEMEGEDLKVTLASSAHHLRLGPAAPLIWQLKLGKHREGHGTGGKCFTRALSAQ